MTIRCIDILYRFLYTFSMNTISLTQARATLPNLVSMATDISNKTYISVNGKVGAVLMNARDLELLEATVEVMSDEKAMKALKQGKSDVKKGKLISWEEIKKELDL